MHASSYLIVDYERSNFSISQCLYEANKPAELVGIPSANNTGPGITKTTASNVLSVGAIVGIVIAVAVFLALSVIGTCFCVRRQKQKKRVEQEKKQIEEEEAIDPRNQKAELGGIPKPKLGELYGEYKPSVESDPHDVNEMEGGKDIFGNDAKLRAEMEGCRGGAEMDSTKSRHELRQSTKNAPIEMWAGDHGLYDELSPHPEDSSRPSPPSRLPSSSGSGRPSPASPASNPRDSRFSWRRRQVSGHSMPEESSGVSSPTDDPSTEHESGSEVWGSQHKSGPRFPGRALTPQDISPQSSKSHRVRRGDNLTRRLEQASKYQGTSHLSVSSPTSESDMSERQHTQDRHDKWNSQFGSQPRDHISAQKGRQKHNTTARNSPGREVSSPSDEGSGRGYGGRSGYHDSWTSRASISSPSSSDERRSEAKPSGFF